MTTDARRYREPLTIERNTPTTDAATRQRVDSWATYITARGHVEDGTPTERDTQDANRSVLVPVTIELRYSAAAALITEGDRVIHDGRTLHIQSARDPTHLKRVIILKCVERTHDR